MCAVCLTDMEFIWINAYVHGAKNMRVCGPAGVSRWTNCAQFSTWLTVIGASVNLSALLNHLYAVPVIFYTSSSYARICFIVLAIKWPMLMKHWQRVEKKMPPYKSIREQSELAYKIKMTAIIVMTLSLSKNKCKALKGRPFLYMLSSKTKYRYNWLIRIAEWVTKFYKWCIMDVKVL